MSEEIRAIKAFNSYIYAIDTFGTIDSRCINNLYEPAKTILNLIEKQQEQLQEKDKIIIEIAKAFKQDDIRNIEEIIEYFTKKAREV